MVKINQILLLLLVACAVYAYGAEHSKKGSVHNKNGALRHNHKNARLRSLDGINNSRRGKALNSITTGPQLGEPCLVDDENGNNCDMSFYRYCGPLTKDGPSVCQKQKQGVIGTPCTFGKSKNDEFHCEDFTGTTTPQLFCSAVWDDENNKVLGFCAVLSRLNSMLPHPSDSNVATPAAPVGFTAHSGADGSTPGLTTNRPQLGEPCVVDEKNENNCHKVEINYRSFNRYCGPLTKGGPSVCQERKPGVIGSPCTFGDIGNDEFNCEASASPPLFCNPGRDGKNLLPGSCQIDKPAGTLCDPSVPISNDHSVAPQCLFVLVCHRPKNPSRFQQYFPNWNTNNEEARCLNFLDVMRELTPDQNEAATKPREVPI